MKDVKLMKILRELIALCRKTSIISGCKVIRDVEISWHIRQKVKRCTHCGKPKRHK